MKKSFGKCDVCPLKDKSMVIGECNCKFLSDVKLLFLAEAPSKIEIEQNTPLCGPAGKIFRVPFNELKLNEIPYVISNVCLCANLDERGRNSNPPYEALECCKPNWQNLINNLPNLKIIVIMGSMPMRVFGIAENGITKLRGKFYSYNGIKVMLTTHPSYVLRNGGVGSDEYKLFENDLKVVKEHIVKSDIDNIKSIPIQNSNKSIDNSSMLKNKKDIHGVENQYLYYYKLPDWCYSEKYVLFDVQYNRDSHEILYIFLNVEDSSKKYYSVNDQIYFYVKEGNELDSEVLLPAKDARVCLGRSNIKKFDKSKYIHFESDVKLEFKHSIDYRLLRKNEEKPVKLKIQYMDIEVFSDGDLTFPKPELAEKPINAISFKNGSDKVNVFIAKYNGMDENPIKDNPEVDVKIFDTEKELLLAYCQEIKKYDPHIITAWNGLGFDLQYIYNRMLKNNIDVNLLSPINRTSFNFDSYGSSYIYGLHFLDLLDVFKMFTYNQESSYKLGAIARKELGKDKVAYEGTLDNVYKTNINKFVEYSEVDTRLLYELENKLKYIELLYEMVRICSSTWALSKTTMGLIDPLLISYAKKMGNVCRNAIIDKEYEKGTIKGAYVRSPIPGLHSYIVDFDFSSLYPSIIVTYNMDPTDTFFAEIDEDIAYKYIYDRNNMPQFIDVKFYPYKINPFMKNVTLNQFNELLERVKGTVAINGCIFMGHEHKKSFISNIVSYLLDSRREYQKKMKQLSIDDPEYNVYKNRQLVYKITNNSIYGVLANKHFRFFNKKIAETITKTGQEVSKFAQYHLGYYLENNEKNIDNKFLEKSEDNIPYICYGDTDSMFVNVYDYLHDKTGLNKDDPDIVKKVLDECKKLEKILNEELLVEYVKLHNIDPKYSLLHLKQEVVADRSIFPDVKKRYCLHIINRDGREVDKYDIKGLCIKRSEYPERTKEYIKELLDMILLVKKPNFLKIREFALDKKNEMIDLCINGDPSIARMVNFSKPVEEYKNNEVPFHVEAMLLWNKLEYECFFHGTKGHLFYIKGIDEIKAPERVRKNKHLITRKNTSIVIPEELERIPEYYIVDVEKMLKYCWINRYKEITDCIIHK